VTARVLEGDVFDLLPTIAAGSVDCCVTSIPYWQLRDYSVCPCVVDRRKRPDCTECDDNGKVPAVRDRQLGMEPTVEGYVERVVEVFRLVRRALADHGTCWLNVGDSYAGGTLGRNDAGYSGGAKCASRQGEARDTPGIPHGNLCLVPQRLALALQADGWVCRSVIVWKKPSPMPASLAGWRWARHRIKLGPKKANGGKKGNHGHGAQANGAFDSRARWADCPGCPKCEKNGGLVLRKGSWRPTSAWEPILMLAKSGGYYYADGEGVKTELAPGSAERFDYPVFGGEKGRHLYESGQDPTYAEGHRHAPNGANARDVQCWSAEPLRERHYAAFPTALVAWCLRAGTSARGYCPCCGAPWARVVAIGPTANGYTPGYTPPGQEQVRRFVSATPGFSRDHQTLGWRPTCPHGDEPRPALVLDPFCGSGRTGIAAQKLCCDFVGIDLSPQYADMARRLLCADMPLFSRAPRGAVTQPPEAS